MIAGTALISGYGAPARRALGLCVVSWMLLSADVAGARDLTRVWRQLTEAPFLLPGTVMHDERVLITRDAWTQWHVAAPGIVSLKLTDDLDPNSTLEAYRSDGTGLLAAVDFVRDAATGLWRLEDLPYRSRIVHVRARDGNVEALVFQLKETAPGLAMGRRLTAREGKPVRIGRHRLDFAESYVVLPAGEPVRFVPTATGAARLRLRMPFSEAPGGWQDYQLQVRAEGKLVQSSRLRAYQDRTQTWIVDGRQALLSRANEVFVDLPHQAASLTLIASHGVFVQAEEVLKKPYLAAAWNRMGDARPDGVDHPDRSLEPFERALAAQKQWQDSVAQAMDNLQADAPLAAAAGSALPAGTSSVFRSRVRERIFSRYTRLQYLLPVQDPAAPVHGGSDGGISERSPAEHFETRRAEFAIRPLLDPEAVGEPRWTSAAQRGGASNSPQSATFVTVPAGARVWFSTPSFEEPTRLRVIARRPEAVEAAGVLLGFPDADVEPIALLIDNGQVWGDRLDPSPTRTYTTGFPSIPQQEVAAIELSVPPRSSALTLRNTSQRSLTVALGLRVPRKFRQDESDWIMARSTSGRSMPELWWETWDSGLDEAGRWQARAASQTALLNGLTPVLHYLSEQANRFGALAATATAEPFASFAPANLHCSGEQTPSAPARVDAARQWERRKQLINANKAWLDALPGLRGGACVDAHMRFAANLVRLGEHQLAEAYWRRLILQTGNVQLRATSIAALDGYYAKQQLRQARLQLRAFVALRWRDAPALGLLAQALIDAGRDQFGIDVAMLLPDPDDDGLLRGALSRRGWSTLLELMGDGPSAGTAPAPEPLRAAPMVRMEFSNSALVVDRLLGESAARPIASAAEPITAIVRGPVALQATLRPLVDTGMPPAEWVLITVNDERLPVPVRGRSGTGRYYIADGQLQVGTTSRRELQLGSGDHHLRIAPAAGAVAVGLLVETPLEWATPGTADDRLRVLGKSQQPDGGKDQGEMSRAPGRGPGFPPEPGVESVRDFIGLGDAPGAWEALLARQPDSQAATTELMAVMAYTAEHDESRRAAAQARGEWLAHGAADDRKVISLRNRLRKHTRWQRLDLVQRSAGMELEPVDRFSPDGEYWRVRNLFLPPWQHGEEMLGSGASLHLSLTAPAPTRLRLELTHLSLDAATLRAANPTPVATVSHNGRLEQKTLPAPGARHEVTLELERGANEVELTLSEFPSTNLIKLRLMQLHEGQWAVLDRTVRKRYVLAAPGEPAEVEISGPAWVRVDELTLSGTVSTYRHLSGGQRLGPLAARSREGSRFRVFARSLRARPLRAGADSSGESGELPFSPGLAPEVAPWPAVLKEEQASVVDLPELAGLAPTTVISLQAPTYSASVGWFADDQAREDVRRPVRDYLELGISRRQRNARDGVYLEANAFARDSSDGEPSFGTSAYYWHRLRNTPFSLRADGSLFGQNASNGFAWASHGQLVLRHFTLSGRQRRHRSEIKLFARYLSEDTGGQELDPDVYSPYLRDHTSGVEFMHRLSAQPTWDTEYFGEVRVRSNELSNPTTDYLRSRLGARAQLGAFQLGSELQVTRYFDDDDRGDGSTIGRLKLLGRWYSAPLAHGRMELRGELEYDMDRQSNSGWVRLLWHFDRVQGIDDFHGDRHWFDPLLVERLRGGVLP